MKNYNSYLKVSLVTAVLGVSPSIYSQEVSSRVDTVINSSDCNGKEGVIFLNCSLQQNPGGSGNDRLLQLLIGTQRKAINETLASSIPFMYIKSSNENSAHITPGSLAIKGLPDSVNIQYNSGEWSIGWKYQHHW